MPCREMDRKIIHLDMDCFYAAVEERENPALRNIPIAVGGTPDGRGVLCTANYPARKFGVRSAMPAGKALRLCPHLRILPVRLALYREASAAIFSILQEYTEIIQPLSLDEAFLDVTQSDACHGSATLIARELKYRIRKEIGLIASAGVAPNKFIAKIASDWQKPDGLFVVPPEQVDEFVRALPVEKIWGVGKVTAEKLHRLGYRTCGDLRKASLPDLTRNFGSFGASLLEFSFGRDDRPVTVDGHRKSLSVENTFPEDLTHHECPAQVCELRKKMLSRLERFLERKPDHAVKGISIKVKFSDFRSTTVDTIGTDLSEDNYLKLLQEGLNRSELPVRLLGCGVRFHDVNDNAPRQLDFLPLLGLD
jgi:DNA polymerase-4